MDDQLVVQMVAAQAAQAECLKGIDEKLERCVNALEGSSGLMIRVDRLEQVESRRSRMIWILTGGFVTLFLNAIATHMGWK